MGWSSRSCRARDLLPTRGNVFADLKQNARHIRQRDAMIDGDVLERARGHAGAHRVAWVLNDGCTAVLLDFAEPGGAVVEPAGEQHADYAASIGPRRAAKQWVDRRPAPVHARAA